MRYRELPLSLFIRASAFFLPKILKETHMKVRLYPQTKKHIKIKEITFDFCRGETIVSIYFCPEGRYECVIKRKDLIKLVKGLVGILSSKSSTPSFEV